MGHHISGQAAANEAKVVERLRRRTFLACATAALTARAPLAWAVPKPYSWEAAPPTTTGEAFVKWMVANRGEEPYFLAQRFGRYQALLVNRDVLDERNKRAFLMTPREEFTLKGNQGRAYDHAFLDIGFGVTISGPHVVSRMTTCLDVKLGEKVLEIGTGSGYQSAYLANLTDKVWSIEIIKPLAERTRGVLDGLIGRGYSEYQAITTGHADGYYGWTQAAPFDKIIVTCGIDHVPPPLLQQLRLGGIMVIPVGPPGAQRLLKIVKEQEADGTIKVARLDIYGGRIVPFVPFTKLDGDTIKGTHNQR